MSVLETATIKETPSNPTIPTAGTICTGHKSSETNTDTNTNTNTIEGTIHNIDTGVQVSCTGVQTLDAKTIDSLMGTFQTDPDSMTRFDIIHVADVRRKFGSDTDVIDAMNRCQSTFSRVQPREGVDATEETRYFLVKELERHLKARRNTNVLMENQKSPPILQDPDSGEEQVLETNDDDLPNTTPTNVPEVSARQKQWDVQFNNLRVFRQSTGHTRVPLRSQKEYPSLGKWVQKQRLVYKQFHQHTSVPAKNFSPKVRTMIQDRIQRLDDIGFEWDCAVRYPPWDHNYHQLQVFVAEHGHAKVPAQFSRNPQLGQWVQMMRKAYREFQKTHGDIRVASSGSSVLTPDRIHALNALDFEWDCSAIAWERSYEELVSYVKDMGHAKVPRVYPTSPSLGIWVCKQRMNYKKFRISDSTTSMTNEKLELLNKVGFEWDCAGSTWRNRYDEVIAYMKVRGLAVVPREFPEKRLLGRWVAYQRDCYKRQMSTMTEHRIELLNEIGLKLDTTTTLESTKR